MFVKLARSRGHTYAQIVESYRDVNGQPRQRNLLTPPCVKLVVTPFLKANHPPK